MNDLSVKTCRRCKKSVHTNSFDKCKDCGVTVCFRCFCQADGICARCLFAQRAEEEREQESPMMRVRATMRLFPNGWFYFGVSKDGAVYCQHKGLAAENVAMLSRLVTRNTKRLTVVVENK